MLLLLRLLAATFCYQTGQACVQGHPESRSHEDTTRIPHLHVINKGDGHLFLELLNELQDERELQRCSTMIFPDTFVLFSHVAIQELLSLMSDLRG